MRNKHSLKIGVSVLLACLSLSARGDDAKSKPVPPLADGVPVQGTIQADEGKRPKAVAFGLSIDDRCIEELTLHTGPNAQNRPQRMWLDVLNAGGKEVFHYRISKAASDYLFFPVLDRGDYRVQLTPDEAGFPYTLQVKRVKAELTDQDRAAAQAAIDRGTQRLLAVTPAKAKDGSFAPAVEGLVIAALASDRSGKNDSVIERDYVPWMTAQFRDQPPEVTWNGHRLFGIQYGGDAMYCHAMATLGLAEAAPRVKAARDLAARAAEFLLAAQLTERRPQPWRAMKPGTPYYGGWRYGPASYDADLSVTGWCVVALTACAVADVQPQGMRESFKDAVGFVRHCASPEGFAYTLGDRPGLNRNAMGALVFRLCGESSRAMPPALEQLDRNLFAGTQGQLDQDYPLYYAYYATRLNYLRGGYPWEAWRMAAVRQLLKLQQPDGSWKPYGGEADRVEDRYSTALGVMILRICLNDVPAYMKQEVRGF
jgi:hypothetical protein